MKAIVIGAGVAGLSIGWRLRQAGADVVVLERAQPGRGATWASAGMIAATAEMDESETAQAQLARHSAGLWPGFAREIEEASGTAIEYRVDGTILAAVSARQASALQQRAEISPGLRFLDAASARSLEPLLTHHVCGALHDPGEAQVDNRALGIALRLAFQKAGGVLQTNEAVIRFETEGGRAVAARTPFRRYEADAFVLAAGAWSGRIEGLPPEAVPPVEPVKGEMIALAPVDDAVPEHMIWGEAVYLVPRRERLLVGATVSREGFDTRITSAAAEWLLGQATSLMPALQSWAVVDQWAGLRPGSPDGLPLLGATALERLFVASGQFRNGILFAPAIAEVMRDVVLGRASGMDLSAFDPRRFAKRLPAS